MEAAKYPRVNRILDDIAMLNAEEQSILEKALESKKKIDRSKLLQLLKQGPVASDEDMQRYINNHQELENGFNR